MIRIILKRKSEIINEFLVRKKTITIGSSKKSDIVIVDKSISDNHCSISMKDGKYELKDNNTLFGTMINNRNVTQYELQNGDIIELGEHSLVFVPDDKVLYIKRALLGIYGKFEGKKYELRDGYTYIGREDVNPKDIKNDIVLIGDMTVSKGHAKISCSEQECLLTDIGSTCGVAVNKKKVGQFNDVVIKNGDEITIGRTIFRYVEGKNEDYGLPRNYGVFLLKIKKPLELIFLLLLIAGSFFSIYRGVTSIKTIRSKPLELSLKNVVSWTAQGNVLQNNNVYDITSSPCLGDLNNDGINDVVSLNASGLLFAWNGETGQQLWQPVHIYNSGKTSPLLNDMNNDGVLDIIVFSDASQYYVIDGQTGVVIVREMLGGVIAETSPAVCDLDEDGKADLVACSEDGNVHFVYSAGFPSQIRKYTETIESPVYASPVIISTQKISPIVVVANYNSKIFLFDAKTRDKKTINLTDKNGKVYFMSSAPVIGDLNGDGRPEIVVQSDVPQYISAVDISQFEIYWTYFVEPVPSTGIKHISSPIITDLDNDGSPDVLALSSNGLAYALKGETGYPGGELLWKVELQDAKRIIAPPALFDFNKDGLLDVVVGGESGLIYVVGGSILKKGMEMLGMVKVSNNPITSSVVIGDVNGDGFIDIVCNDVLGKIQLIETKTQDFKDKVIWPMYLGNSLRSGNSSTIFNDEKKYKIMIAAGIFVFLLVIIVRSFIKRSKMKKRPNVISI